jgi:hypothetical protein
MGNFLFTVHTVHYGEQIMFVRKFSLGDFNIRMPLQNDWKIIWPLTALNPCLHKIESIFVQLRYELTHTPKKPVGFISFRKHANRDIVRLCVRVGK